MAPTTMRQAIVPILLTGLTAASPLPPSTGYPDGDNLSIELACKSIDSVLPLLPTVAPTSFYYNACSRLKGDASDDLLESHFKGSALQLLVPDSYDVLKTVSSTVNHEIREFCWKERETLCSRSHAELLEKSVNEFTACTHNYLHKFFGDDKVSGYGSYCARVVSEINIGKGSKDSKDKRHHLAPLANLHSNGLDHELAFDGTVEKRELLSAVVGLDDPLVKLTAASNEHEKRELQSAVVGLDSNLVKLETAAKTDINKRELLNAIVSLHDPLVRLEAASKSDKEKRELLSAVVDLKDNLVKLTAADTNASINKRELLNAVVGLTDPIVKLEAASRSDKEKRELLSAIVALNDPLVKLTASEPNLRKRELLSAVVSLNDPLVKLATDEKHNKREISVHPKELGPATHKVLDRANDQVTKVAAEAGYPAFVAVGEVSEATGPLVAPTADYVHDTAAILAVSAVDAADQDVANAQGAVANVPAEVTNAENQATSNVAALPGALSGALSGIHPRQDLPAACASLQNTLAPTLENEQFLTTLLCAVNPLPDSQEAFLLTALFGANPSASDSSKQPLAITSTIGQIQSICKTKAVGFCAGNGIKDASNCARDVLALVMNECESNFDDPTFKHVGIPTGETPLHPRGLRDESWDDKEVEAARKAWTTHKGEKPSFVPRQVDRENLLPVVKEAEQTVGDAATELHVDDALEALPRAGEHGLTGRSAEALPPFANKNPLEAYNELGAAGEHGQALPPFANKNPLEAYNELGATGEHGLMGRSAEALPPFANKNPLEAYNELSATGEHGQALPPFANKNPLEAYNELGAAGEHGLTGRSAEALPPFANKNPVEAYDELVDDATSFTEKTTADTLSNGRNVANIVSDSIAAGAHPITQRAAEAQFGVENTSPVQAYDLLLNDASTSTAKITADTLSNGRNIANIVTDSVLAPAAESVKSAYEDGLTLPTRDINDALVGQPLADVNHVLTSAQAAVNEASTDAGLHAKHTALEPVTDTVHEAADDVKHSLPPRANEAANPADLNEALVAHPLADVNNMLASAQAAANEASTDAGLHAKHTVIEPLTNTAHGAADNLKDSLLPRENADTNLHDTLLEPRRWWPGVHNNGHPWPEDDQRDWTIEALPPAPLAGVKSYPDEDEEDKGNPPVKLFPPQGQS